MPPPPAASRLTLKPRKNRRRPGPPTPLWSRVPKPPQIADACGRALRRSLPALAGAGVIAALCGSAWAGYHFATTSPRFAITEIAVYGNHQLSDDDVRDAAGIRTGDNVFSTQLDAVVRELRANPWIIDAEAHRVLPHTIALEIREHVAAGLADLGELYLVDADGHAFKRAAIDSRSVDGGHRVGFGAGETDGLPLVTGLDRAAYLAAPDATARVIRDALAALATWRATPDRPDIGELHVDPHGALTLHTRDGATAIQLGALGPDLAARMQTFDAAWASLADSERARARAVHLDIRPDHVTVALHED